MTPDEQRAEAQKVVDRIWAVIEYDQDGRWWMDNLKAIAIVRHALRDERRRGEQAGMEKAAEMALSHISQYCKDYEHDCITAGCDNYGCGTLKVIAKAIREQARRAGEAPMPADAGSPGA